LALKVGGVGRDVAFAVTDDECLIAAQATQLAEGDDHRYQRNYCDCGGDYGD
jgi:hypothetical protein